MYEDISHHELVARADALILRARALFARQQALVGRLRAEGKDSAAEEALLDLLAQILPLYQRAYDDIASKSSVTDADIEALRQMANRFLPH